MSHGEFLRTLQRQALKKGFTLIELLVSVSIMAIILGITFSGGPQSVAKLALADNVYQVELMLREAQLQGSAINSVNDVYGGVGVFFDKATSSLVLKFRDRVDPNTQKAIKVGNGLYDSGPIDEKELTYRFTNNHKVGQLCVATSTSPLLCGDSNIPPVTTLTVSFTRPKQIAHIYVNGATTTDYTMACIQFNAPTAPASGYVRSLYVYRSGMIAKEVGVCH